MDSRPEVSGEFAERYFAARLYASRWTSASETDKEKSLAQASYLIASAFDFTSDAFEIDASGEIVWHERVMAAVCEEALWLLTRDPTLYPETLTLGLSQGAAGPVSATFDRRYIAPLICEASKRLVGRLGAFDGADDASGSCRSTPLAL